MLIEQKFVLNDVVTIKVISGEEIIARFVEETSSSYVISKPVSLVLAGSQNGQGMVAMAPFMLGITDDAKLPINKSTVITIDKARKDAAMQYQSATSSIQVANSMPSGLTL